jgi:hypothetical protein
MRGVKGTHGVAWYWKDKARVRLIAASVPRRQVAHTLAVYDVLVMLCNNHGDKRFTEHVSTICQLTGMSFKGVARAMAALQELDLIRVESGGRAASGLFARRTFEITKGPVALSLDESTTGEIEADSDGSAATESGNSTISTPKSPVALSSYESANIRKNKRTRTEEVVVEGARARSDDDSSVLVVDAQSESAAALRTPVTLAFRSWQPLAINTGILADLADLTREHGEAQVLRAIREAQGFAGTVDNPTKFLQGKLTKEKARGYTWQTASERGEKPRYGSVPLKPIDPVEARFQKSQLYRQLDADVECGPFFVLERIKDLAPRYNVDLAPYAVLDASPPPPKAEQRRLIRAFVATVDPSVTAPSYVDA